MPPRRVGRTDLVLLVVLTAALWWLAGRVRADFVYAWDWTVVPRLLVRWDPDKGRWVANLLLEGFLVTLRLAFWSSLMAALVGLLVALARLAHQPLPQLLGWAYVELLRNIPPLVFVFVFYFFLSSQLLPATGIGQWARDADATTRTWIFWLTGNPRQLEAFVSGVLILGLLEGAYVAEILRAGIEAVPKGQWEAARSLGLPALDVWRFIVLPQAIQRIVPPLASQFISLVKDSSIVSLISIPELTFMGSQTVVSTGRAFEIWITVATLYFGLCFGLALLFGRLERRLRKGAH